MGVDLVITDRVKRPQYKPNVMRTHNLVVIVTIVRELVIVKNEIHLKKM